MGVHGCRLMQGGDGDDIYFVDNAGDSIVEKDNLGAGGYDTVLFKASAIYWRHRLKS